ncbi:MAG: 5-deoxy-glucuronate isomerase [Gemmatimonadota bacterium]|nr:5-deoxy-glucuronate isomerase [Gemmatimonadota bacterium]
MSSRWHFAAGSLGAAHDEPVRIAPERAGWRYAGLRVLRLAPGERRREVTGDSEMLVLPLSGGCTVELEGNVFELHGRDGVFTGITDFAYLPPGLSVVLHSTRGAELALPSARAERRRAAYYVPSPDVPVEVRGAGRATRQINNLFTAGNSEAQRLAVVEVLAPGGNWSSYPPHKHDERTDSGEEELEEIYYFRIGGRHGFGLHRTYTTDGELDETVTVRDGDVFLVPRGYHGPCIAAPEFPMYYLNVLAGPGSERRLGFSDDPAYAWVRSSWADQERDPRVPLVRAPEVVR